ncbi:Polygalacturonase inhibitor [Rhynchospora pubera]|uniref:Polygalacturonase inhibitor n=1 Tax=Rhynchospora pubera TaxID=906938 RepID=A0AAV8H002_9POAL|nr:Polygalacturonase inhibitor [Rhynchospora pubera]KAJ4811205.1 Polygalacturonase inhibitor [Rhynchospora pubera]
MAHRHSLLFACLFLVLLASPTLASKCDSGDLKALLSIKQSLGNPSILSSWVPSTSCCSWGHLQCDRAGRVNSITIRDSNLAGTIPPSVTDLTALISLAFIDLPGLTGPIPTSIFTLKTLQQVTVIRTSVSGFSGPVPDSISQLSQIDTLDLSANKITGPIPASLSKLPKLRFLDLSHNQLTGSIPSGLVHGNFAFLILSHNLLTGRIPVDYGSTDFDTINLSHNRLIGDASFLFGAQKKTTEIYLAWNRLEFDISNVAFPKGLTDLDLSHNKITGRVPVSIRDLAKVHKLDLSYNKLCGQIPSVGVNTHLGVAAFGHNKCLCGGPLAPCHKN